jgi:hypothetical protein
VTQDSRPYTQSRSCYDPERSRKISPGVFRVDTIPMKPACCSVAGEFLSSYIVVIY